MVSIRQWAVSLCFAAAAGGILSNLLPNTGTAKAARIAVSLFFLCALVLPLNQLAKQWELEIPYQQSEYSAAAVEFEENAQELAYLLAESNINEMIQNTLTSHQIYPKESQVVLQNDDGEITLKVFLLLLPEDQSREEEIRKILRQDFGVEAYCQFS